MRIIHTLVLSLAFILNSIELSSQFECLPNGEPIVWTPRSKSPHSPFKRQSPGNSRLSVKPNPRSSSAGPSLRSRTKSPSASCRIVQLVRMKLELLRFVRLIPKSNPNQRFEIRKHTFPRNKPIQVRGDLNLTAPMPTEELNVLSTSNGNVFAILEGIKKLRGIYGCTKGHGVPYQTEKQVKMNMHSGVVVEMTLEEIKESPLGRDRPIVSNFDAVWQDGYSPEN